MKKVSKMLRFEDALKITVDNAARIPSERVGLMSAAGRVLREDVKARFDVPPFDKSAMDGYAVKVDDLTAASKSSPVTLHVVAEQPAGKVTDARVERGKAVRIMTGAPLPRGAEAVVIQENTKRIRNVVEVFEPVKPFANCGHAGEDVKKGDVVVPSGTVLGPAELGMIASTGKPSVKVSRKPRVAVLSTGDEILRPGSKRRSKAAIFDANGYSLVHLARRCGCEARYMGIARDKPGLLESKLEQASDHDLTLLSGGVSVGDFDFVRDQLKAMGFREVYWGVAMKPGKPTFFGKKGRRAVFGLPGNPVSVMVVFHVLVRPYIDTVLGKSNKGLKRSKGILAGPIKIKGTRRNFQRARGFIDDSGKFMVEPFPNQKSGVLRSMVETDLLLDLPPGPRTLQPGDVVDVLWRDERW